MIRHRLAELGGAVAHAIEVLRAAQRLEGVTRQTVLGLLAQAACSERATYWAIDPNLMRLCALASWGMVGSTGSTSDGETPYRRITSLSQGNAGQVWRSRKPLWSTSFVLDARPQVSCDESDAGLRGGLWFAVKTDTSMYGVIELLGRALEAKIPDNLVVVERLGFRLGHTLEELRYGRAQLRMH